MIRSPGLFAMALGLVFGLNTPILANAPKQQGPQLPDSVPSFELDAKGQKAHLDFSLGFHPISDAKLKFSQFANRKVMIFYFSAKCPHCLHAAPHVQKLADQLATKGVQSLAIAIKWNSEDDIRTFIRDFRIHMPVFHDDSRKFGENYGTGSIPLVLVANEKGEYMRFKNFDTEQTPAQIMAGVNLIAKK